MGAAVQGHILAQGDARTGGSDLAGTTDLLLLDVTPLSLGIELEGREMSVLIKRNTTIPCRKSRSYTTVEDWQTSIDVVVYEVRRWSGLGLALGVERSAQRGGLGVCSGGMCVVLLGQALHIAATDKGGSSLLPSGCFAQDRRPHLLV